MASLILACLLFLGSHLIIAGGPLRGPLVRALGEPGYRGLFSVLEIVLLGWVILAYVGAPRESLWMTPTWLRWLALVINFLAAGFIVIGLLTPSPTAAGGEGQLKRPDAARGVLRITRHPFLCGVALWAITHLVTNGDTASLVLFATLFLLAALGPRSIDAKRARQYGERWQQFAAATSVLPFAAIAAGRNRFVPGEIGAWRVGVAVLVFVVLLVAHRWIVGVPALPA